MRKNKTTDGRIFISYRRTDAKGYAGRLSDSLEGYFGNNRVFRDIEDIKGGATFGDVIKKNIQDADAVIVLIGSSWLSVAGEDNTQRIFASGDWVAQEIHNAIELGIPVFPVLIEDTPMPREEELPEKLRPILQYNASHLSDKSWNSDVLRIAKVLSFDIPSMNERKVNFAKMWSSICIFTTLAITTCILFYNFYLFLNNPDGNDTTFKHWKDGENYKNELIDEIKYLHDQNGYRVFRDIGEDGFEPLDERKIETLRSQEKLVITREEIDTLQSQNIVILSEDRFESIKGQDIVVLSEDRFDSSKNRGIVVISKESSRSDKSDRDFVVITKNGLFESNKGLFGTKVGSDPALDDTGKALKISSNRDIVILSKAKFDSLDNKNKFKDITLQKFELLRPWATVPPYVGISISLLLIFYVIPYIDKERQKYLFATIYSGSLGLFIIIMGVLPIREEYETMWLYLGSVIIATVMFAFMNMSGFKVK